jgi:hypothetical protein
MRRHGLHRLGVLLMMILGGCGSAPRGEAFRPEVADPEQGVLYVFREAVHLTHPAVRLVLDQDPVGELRPGEYVALVVKPGEHFLRVESGSEDTRKVRLIPGESAFVRVVTQRFEGERPTLDQPESERARQMIARTVRARR